MYIFDIFCSYEENKELQKLFKHSFIHSASLCENFIRIRTRKLWKLYWLHQHFKEFDHEFSYCILSNTDATNQKILSIIKNNHRVVIEDRTWICQKIYIHFSNIHDVWRVRFLSLLL